MPLLHRLAKGFDRVYWTKLLKILRNIEANWRELRLIHNLYMKQTIKLRLNQGETAIWRLEEQLDKDVACHPFHLTYLTYVKEA